MIGLAKTVAKEGAAHGIRAAGLKTRMQEVEPGRFNVYGLLEGTGKFMRKRAGKRHILTSKNRERKRRLSGSVVVDETKAAALKRLLPYT